MALNTIGGGKNHLSGSLLGVSKTLLRVMDNLETLERASARAVDASSFLEAGAHLSSVRKGKQESERPGARGKDEGQLLPKTALYAMKYSDTVTNAANRLGLIAGKGEKTGELSGAIFQSANRTFTPYTDTADMVANLGTAASSSFGSTDEIIAFSEQFNKHLALSGAAAEDKAGARQQLVQTMASGMLGGEEFYALLDRAPSAMESVADYLGVSAEKLKEMAEKGQVASDVVKNALLAAAEETDERFRQIPNTVEDMWTLFRNSALWALNPIWERLQELASNEKFQQFVLLAGQTLSSSANTVVGLLSLIETAGEWCADNWSIVAPMIGTVTTAVDLAAAALDAYNAIQTIKNGLNAVGIAKTLIQNGATIAEAAAAKTATGAQVGLNAAMLASPITWIVAGIFAVIAALYIIVGIINQVTGESISATGVLMGAVFTVGAFLFNTAMGIGDFILSLVSSFFNIFGLFANFLMNLFVNPIGAVIYLFQGMFDVIMNIIQGVVSALDFIFGQNWAGAVQGLRDRVKQGADDLVRSTGGNPEDYQTGGMELSLEKLGVKRFEYGAAYGAGYGVGKGIEDKLGGMFDFDSLGQQAAEEADKATSGLDGIPAYDSIAKNTADTADNTKKIADSVTASEEDLKFLRDIAEREVINRFTTAEIRIDMQNNNTLNSSLDVDSTMEAIGLALSRQMLVSAEGA